MRGFFATGSKVLRLFPLVVFLYIVLFPYRGFPQFEEEIFFETEEWVETAAKRLQRIEESPAAVTVISAEEIRNSGATTLPEVLRRVPGLEVMCLSASDCEVGARGQNKPMSNGVLALVNGRAVYETFFGVVLWNYKDFPLEMIERVEVVRGPGSVLYGANAFHAVVNIITKTHFEAPATLLSFTGGPYERVGTLMASGQSGKIGHLVSVGWTQFMSYSDRHKISAQYPRLRASLLYDSKSWGKILVEGGTLGGDFETFYDIMGMIEGFSTTHNIMVKYELPDFYFRTYWYTIDADKAAVPEVNFDGIVVMGIPIYLKEGFELAFELEHHILDFEAQKIFELPFDNLIAVGASYRFTTTDYRAFEAKRYETEHLSAAYVQHEYEYRPFVHTYLGVRWDHHPLTGHTFSPRGSVLVTPLAGHTLRASVGKSFRNPTFVENYIDMSVALDLPGGLEGNVGVVGSTDLDPEELTSYEVGYQASLFTGRVKAGVSYFFNQIDNMLFPLFPEDYMINIGHVTGSFVNIYDEEAWGVEAELKAQPFSWMAAFANYTYTEVEDLTFGGADERTPRNKVNGGITVGPLSNASATVLAHYVGETRWPPTVRHPNLDESIWMLEVGDTDPYTLLNVRVAYRFLKDQAEASLSLYNLMGDDHLEFPLSEKIPTRISGTVRVTF